MDSEVATMCAASLRACEIVSLNQHKLSSRLTITTLP